MNHRAHVPTKIEPLEPRQLLNAILRVDVNSPAANPDGASWTTSYADLQQALSAAVFGDEIRVADGIYKPTGGTDRTISFELKDGVWIFGGYAGVGAASPDDHDPVLFSTVLSGDIGEAGNTQDNSYHIAAGSGLSIATVLDGLTFTGGTANGQSTANDVEGPGLLLQSGGLAISRCIFRENLTSGWGALTSYGTSTLTLTDCRFERNDTVPSAFLRQGGAIYAEKASKIGSLVVDRCTFLENVTNHGGGAVRTEGLNLSISRSRFVRNIIRRIPTGQTSGGGAVYARGYQSATISESTFEGNRSASDGGALLLVGSGGSTSTVVNSAFVGNTADFSGGAIKHFVATTSVTDCAFVANSGISAGAIHSLSGSITVKNGVAWANLPAASAPLVGMASVGYTDVTGGFAGAGNINADPQFVRNPSPGADNTWGTPDDDYGDLRLQITSPCIDAGDNDSVPAGVTTDIAGRARFFDFPGVNDPGAIVDMGANELEFRLGLLRVPAGQTVNLPAGGYTFFVEQLLIEAGGTLDVRDDGLIVDYTGVSQLAALQSLINTARAGGAWTGTGMTSSNAKNNPPHNTTLGAIEASDFKSIYGPAALFGGHAIDSSAVLVQYTYYGDIDFNGLVDFDDYSRIDAGFNNIRTGWLNGDVDGNGIIDFDDYSLIDQAFNTQGAALRLSRPRIGGTRMGQAR